MIFKIFKKELKETLRDKRTMIMMVVIPMLVFPLLINVVTSISGSFEDSAEEKKIKIGIIGDTSDYLAQKLYDIPSSFGPKELVAYAGDSSQMLNDYRNEKLDILLFYEPNIQKKLDANEKAIVKWTLDKTKIGNQGRAKSYMQIIEAEARFLRYDALGIDEEALKPFEVIYENSASEQQMIGELAGGFLPYIFIPVMLVLQIHN